MHDPKMIRLWDDNPTEEDMLGFGPVVESVIAAASSADLDPVTVALQSSWGGGKSSALKLIEKRLRLNEEFVVVVCDPWEYDDLPKAEVRALLIGQVLAELAEKPGVSAKAQSLLKRIAWVKVGATITNMVLARTLDVEKLAEVFTPNPKEPTSMAGFRKEFSELMEKTTTVKKVVVLVDDLDRCSPDSVVAILEAIKVFLSVPKMAFVLAAEEALIRFAIERSTNSGARSTYSDRYLEKIVQLPVRLPTLSREDAETFILLLLAKRRSAVEGQTSALLEHVAYRREHGIKPYIGGPYADGVQVPIAEDLALAAQVAWGLSVDKWSSPRAIKRFLNAWGVRVSIAQARGADLNLDVMLKLYILEDRFPKSFSVLVEAQPEERGQLLDTWEAWAKAESETSEAAKPDGVEEDTRAWASTPPGLATVAGKIDTYLNVAATFTSVSAGEGLSTETLRLMDDLLDNSEPIRRTAINKASELPIEEREAVVNRLLQRAGAVDATVAIESAAEVAKSDPSLAEVFHTAAQTHALPHVTLASVVDIASVDGARETLSRLTDGTGIEADIKEAASSELAGLNKAGA